jgi:single-stranded-DNA-specific exonuclease
VRIDEAKLGEFRDRFAKYTAENPIPEGLDRELRIDAEVRLADVTHRAIKELDRLGPFGQQNSHPVFSATHVELAQPAATMGEGGRHLNIHVKQFGTRVRAIAFGRGEWAEELNRLDRPFAISFAPILNEFRGRENVELKLIDWHSGE